MILYMYLYAAQGYMGPVVQSIVSLTSMLMTNLLTIVA